VSIIFSSVTASSFIRNPPFLIWRRASPFRSDQTRFDEGCENAEPAFELCPSDVHGRQRCRERAFLEGAACGLGGVVGSGAPCTSAVASVARTFLARDLLTLERGEPFDLIEWQQREQLEEAHDVAVLGVAPILPVVIGAEEVGIEPHRGAGRRVIWRPGVCQRP